MDKIKTLEEEILLLRKSLKAKEDEISVLKELKTSLTRAHLTSLSNNDISRYSRQIIIPGIGMNGQLTLKKSSVLIVGVGGLGCPSALYLAGSGVGHIGLVDYDEVEINNLHRQLLHTELNIGMSKVESARENLMKLNSNIQLTTYREQLDSQNALRIIKDYDVVLDATDNVATRYLLNDACVLSGRPLVSGSALRLEGQLTVYNYNDGPCYRCLFPTPPPPETVTNCGDGGVLGVVPGVIGILQAAEAIKIILKMDGVLSEQLLLYDFSDCTFPKLKIRGKSSQCAVCGIDPTITELIDYEQFCGAKANDKDKCLKLVDKQNRVTASEFHAFQQDRKPMLLIDVRSAMEFEICQLPGAENIPIDNFTKTHNMDALKNTIGSKYRSEHEPFPVFVVCRRGNDSQRAVVKLQETLEGLNVTVKDITGGLHAWARDVDPTFPVY